MSIIKVVAAGMDYTLWLYKPMDFDIDFGNDREWDFLLTLKIESLH